MISYNNAPKLMVSQNNENSLVNLKAKTSQGASTSDFKSVFDKTLNNSSGTSKNTSNALNSNNDKQVSGNAEVKPKYNSFRDVQAERTAASEQSNVGKVSGGAQSEELSSVSESMTKEEKYDDQIVLLAQMFGISPGELMKLAKQLGFSAEDLRDVKKLALFVQKLGELLELNDSQKEILLKMAEEANRQAGAAEKTEGAQSAGSAVKAADSGNGTGIDADRLSKLSADLKAKIDAMIKEGKTDSESISSEISKILASMKAQAQNRLSVSSVSNNSSEISLKPENTAENTGVNPEVKQEAKTDKAEETVTGKEAASDKVTSQVDTKSGVQVDVSNDQNQQQNVQVFGDVKVNMANTQNTVSKTEFTMPQPVRSTEVVNQVVEKAKVILGQDKSEMVIQLKPDHLGKLELKVVTEQGIVAAKFVAENQKVKEIIESNMQLLKDSLEKQGIAIDSVSVQVGHDKKGDYSRQNSYAGKSSGSANRVKYGEGGQEGMKVAGNILETLPERLAQYSYETNTINLTA